MYLHTYVIYVSIYIYMYIHINNKTLIFGDRFPFRYLADDYGMPYFAAFVGCSAETGIMLK